MRMTDGMRPRRMDEVGAVLIEAGDVDIKPVILVISPHFRGDERIDAVDELAVRGYVARMLGEIDQETGERHRATVHLPQERLREIVDSHNGIPPRGDEQTVLQRLGQHSERSQQTDITMIADEIDGLQLLQLLGQLASSE